MIEHTENPDRSHTNKLKRNLLLAALVTIIAVVIMIFATSTLTLSARIVSTAPLPNNLFLGRQSDPVVTQPSTVMEKGDNETNAKKSSWSVLSQTISVGRPLHILLTTHDRRGNRRTNGGDLFNAVLRSDGTKSPSASIIGGVEDFLNGSYLITFVPPWSGPATVHIKLWMTRRVIEITKGTVTLNYIFLCAFGHKYANFHQDYVGPPTRIQLLPKLEAALKAKQIDVGLCHMDWQPKLPRSSTSCSMPFPSNYHWYGICEGPRARNSTSCDSLPYCVYDKSMVVNNVREQAIVTENTGAVPGGVKTVIISKRADNGKETMNKEPCQPQPYVRASGYWLGGKWINRDCSFPLDSKDMWWKCLSGRDLHFIGDSTIRQLFALLLSTVGIKVPPTFVPSILAKTFVNKYNATVRYRMHGPPVMSSNSVNFSGAPISADLIDAIPANGNEILVMSMIHHFILLPPEAFQLRIQLTIAAIRRLRQRNMGGKIPIVFRTANPRASDSFRVNVYRVNWYNQMATEAFVASNVGVIVYDIFNMAAAGPNPEEVHQTGAVMSVELSHILSLSCY